MGFYSCVFGFSRIQLELGFAAARQVFFRFLPPTIQRSTPGRPPISSVGEKVAQELLETCANLARMMSARIMELARKNSASFGRYKRQNTQYLRARIAQELGKFTATFAQLSEQVLQVAQVSQVSHRFSCASEAFQIERPQVRGNKII